MTKASSINGKTITKKETKLKLLLFFNLKYRIPQPKLKKEFNKVVSDIEEKDIKNQIRKSFKKGIVDTRIHRGKIKNKGQLYKALKKIDKWQLVYRENGKKPIRLATKVELDFRYNEQMAMLLKAYDSGEDLFYLSSHIDCSDRCRKWQGKCVSLTLPPINSRFETGTKFRGYKVYSFNAIINQVDKYGYKNNIIVGFNCRHSLLKASTHKKPREYTKRQSNKAYKINNEMRRRERNIRDLKQSLELYKVADGEIAKKTRMKIKKLTNDYERFCKKHKANIDLWRLDI